MNVPPSSRRVPDRNDSDVTTFGKVESGQDFQYRRLTYTKVEPDDNGNNAHRAGKPHNRLFFGDELVVTILT